MLRNSNCSERLTAWLRSLTGTEKRRRRERQATEARIVVHGQTLENKTLLAADLNFSLDGNFEAIGESQFGFDTTFLGFGFEGATGLTPTNSAGDPQAEPKFFGFEFDTGDIQKTAIAEDPFFGTKWGGEFRADLNGRLGVEVGAYINTGSIDVQYGGSGNLTIRDASSLGAIDVESSFTFDNAEFATLLPQPGLFVDVIADIDGGIGATACIGGCLDIDIPLDVEFDQEIVAFNRDNDRELRLMGIELGGQPSVGADYDFEGGKGKQSAEGGSGVSTGVYVDFGPDDSELWGQEISFGVGLGVKQVLDLTREAGSLTLTIPDYQLTNSAPDSAGVLTANTDDLDRLDDGTHPTQIARLDLDLPTLAQFPLSGEFSLGIGPAKLSGQLISYILEASLGLDQDVKVVPEYFLTLSLDQPAPVSIAEGAYTLMDTVRVVPGTDVDILFLGEPITVTPSYSFGVRVDNTLDLGVDLGGYLELLSLGFDVAGNEIFDLGPLLGRDETGSTFVENEPIARLFGDSFYISGGSNFNSFNRTGNPYTIGQDFELSGDSAQNPLGATSDAGATSTYQFSAQGLSQNVTKRVATASNAGYSQGDLVSTGPESGSQVSSDLKGPAPATGVAKETRLLEPANPGASVTLNAYRDPLGERHEGHPDVNASDPNLTDAHLNTNGAVSRAVAENSYGQWVSVRYAQGLLGEPQAGLSELVIGGWTPVNVLFDQVNLLTATGNAITNYQSNETFEFDNPYIPLNAITHTIPRVNYIDHVNDPRPVGQGNSRSAHAYFWSGKGIPMGGTSATEDFTYQELFGSGVEFGEILERTAGQLESPWLGHRGEFDSATFKSLGSPLNTFDDVVIRYFDDNTRPLTVSETRGGTGFGFDRPIWSTTDLVTDSAATEVLFETQTGEFESLRLPSYSSNAEPATPDSRVLYGFTSDAADLLNDAEFQLETLTDGTWTSVGTIGPGDTVHFGAGLYSDNGVEQFRLQLNDPAGSMTASELASVMQNLIAGVTFAADDVRFLDTNEVLLDAAFTASRMTADAIIVTPPAEPADLHSADNQALETDTFGSELPVFDNQGNPTGQLASELQNILFNQFSNLSDFSGTVLTGYERYSVDVPLTIPDGGVVTSTLVVEDSFDIADLDVRINILHERAGDLQASLISPSGTRVQLFSEVGGTGANFVQTKLDDEAYRPDGTERHINDAGEVAPFSGRFRPPELLSAFDGEDAAGTWTLEIRDLTAGVEGELTRWSILPRVSRTADATQITELQDRAAAGSDVQGQNIASPAAIAGSSAANPISPEDATATPLEYVLTTWNATVGYTDFSFDGEVFGSSADLTPRIPFSALLAEGGPLAGLIDLSDPDAAAAAIAALHDDGRLLQVSRTGDLGVSDPIYVTAPDSGGYQYDAPDGTLISSLSIDGDFGTSPLLGDTWDLFVPDGNGGFRFLRTVNCLHTVDLPEGGVESLRLYARPLPGSLVPNQLNAAAPELSIVVGVTLSGSPVDSVPTLTATSLGERMPSVVAPQINVGGFADDGAADTFRIVRNGLVVDVFVNGALHESVSAGSVNEFFIDGSTDEDRLIVDLSGGPIGIPMTFSGGAGDNDDTIEVTGGLPTQFDHVFTNELSGQLTIDASTLAYQRVERIIDATQDYSVAEGRSIELNHVTLVGSKSGTNNMVAIDFDYDGTTFDVDANVPEFDANGFDGPTSVVAAVRMADSDGNVSIPVLSNVVVSNVAPTVEAGSDVTINENVAVHLEDRSDTIGSNIAAMFGDIGTSDSHFAMVDWGDGSPIVAADVVESPVGRPGIDGGAIGSIQGSHTYADDGVYVVTVSVRDDDMLPEAWVTDTFTVTVLNVTPSIEAGPDVTTEEGRFVSLVPATFSDPGFDFEPGGTAEDFAAFIDWGDGTTEPLANITLVDNADGAAGILTTGTINAAHAYGDNGVYTVIVGVRDDDMPSDAWVTDTFAVTVLNVTPSVEAGPDVTTEEGAFVSLPSTTFSDPGFDFEPGGTAEDFSAFIDWGDGTTEPLADITLIENADGAAGILTTGTINAAHAYADNGDYTVTVSVRDDDMAGGEFVSDSFVVVVTNVAPTIEGQLQNSSPGFGAAAEADLVIVSAAFSDAGFDNSAAGTAEQFAATTIDWGDGTVETVPDIDVVKTSGAEGVRTTGQVTGHHRYEFGGLYTVTMTVRDDDGGQDVIQTTVQVEGVGIVDGVLYVVGTDQKDRVDISADLYRGRLRVETRLDRSGPWWWSHGGSHIRRTYDLSAVTQIEVLLGDGHDVAAVNERFVGYSSPYESVPIVMFGGGGNDYLRSGHGDAFIDAGDGDNWIYTGNGNDTVIAGNDRDIIYTGKGDDSVTAGDGNNVIDTGDGDDSVRSGRGHDVVFAGRGNDRVITGDGNDFVRGGNGNDLIITGAGDDIIFAGRGNDVVIGGAGRDYIYGSRGQDLLIAGSALFADDEDQLDALYAEWNAQLAFHDRVDNLRNGTGSTGFQLQPGVNVLDDADRDFLIGGASPDWIFANDETIYDDVVSHGLGDVLASL